MNKKPIQLFRKCLPLIYFFIIISWEAPLPVKITATETLSKIQEFYNENNSLPNDLSFISDGSLLSDIKQFDISYHKEESNFVRLDVGVPTYTYEISYFDRLTAGLFINKGRTTGTVTSYGRKIK